MSDPINQYPAADQPAYGQAPQGAPQPAYGQAPRAPRSPRMARPPRARTARPATR